MTQTQKKRLTWLRLLLALNIILLGAIFFWQPHVLAQSYIGAPAPQATLALPDMVATQQVQIDSMQREIQYLNKDNQLLAEDYRIQLDMKLWVLGLAALGITGLAGLLGWKSYSDIDKGVRERLQTSFDKEILGFDPKSLVVRIRQDRHLERVQHMLELYGLKSELYSKLGRTSTSGVTIVPIESPEDENELATFVENYDDDIGPSKTAFVIYALKGFRVTKPVLLEHECITLANLPVTVANAVLIVGRGLR